MTIEKKKIIIIFIWLCLVLDFCYIFYNTLKPHSLVLRNETDDVQDEEDVDMYLVSRVRNIALNKHKIKYLKELIKEINEEQHIGSVHHFKASAFINVVNAFNNSKRFRGIKLENTVLVVQVHRNYKYVEVFLRSIRQVVGISGSLLIFAHDYYSPRIFRLINKVQFARVMQMFYPYSTQLHPYSYPGDDVRFCPEWNNCYFSNERADANMVQAKLFWWWTINEVFDHVQVLKNYNGYIYFMEAESYLTTDFIVMAKKLEQYLPFLCPECRMLSLAARPPRAEVYGRGNSSVIIGIWGWSNYSNSGIGFNRSTWNEIKALREEFCYFNDYSWELSLRHLASKTREKQLFMLSSGGPRIFLTNDCTVFGNATHCDLNSTYQDILNFTRTISDGLFAYRHKLDFEDINGVILTDVEESGGWEDARDRELCMFFASEGRRLYY